MPMTAVHWDLEDLPDLEAGLALPLFFSWSNPGQIGFVFGSFWLRFGGFFKIFVDSIGLIGFLPPEIL
ncbi:MAG TPA: hypothetical protein VGZ29_13910 [Terriglobia bacterium]|nr:hypothetical protein [Terriglobia bacterium]